MLSVVTSGTQTATLDTEHILAMTTQAGIYQLLVDTNDLVNGDIVILRCYVNATAPGSPANERAYFQQVFAHQQSDPVKCSIPVTAPYNCRWTLEQTDGAAGRSFPWSLVSI